MKLRNKTYLKWNSHPEGDDLNIAPINLKELYGSLYLESLEIWTVGDGIVHVAFSFVGVACGCQCSPHPGVLHSLRNHDVFTGWFAKRALPQPEDIGGGFKLNYRIGRKQPFTENAMEFARDLCLMLGVGNARWYSNLEHHRVTEIWVENEWVGFNEYLLKKYPLHNHA